MADLQRSGSVLVTEIKADHAAQAANGHADNGSAVPVAAPEPSALSATAVPGTATDGGVAPAEQIDPTLTSPAPAAGHSLEPSQTSAAPIAPEPIHVADAGQIPAVSAVNPSAAPETAPIDTAVPLAPTAVGPGSAISPDSRAAAPAGALSGSDAPTQGAAVPAAAAGAAAGTAAAAPAGPTPLHPVVVEAPQSALSSSDVKKYDKLMKAEAKSEEKSLKKALKEASESEKLVRKAREEEQDALKQQQKATTREHKASKELAKAKAEYDKYVTDLEKAKEKAELKKKHHQDLTQNYESAKARIEQLRSQKLANDQDRAKRAASVHGTVTSLRK